MPGCKTSTMNSSIISDTLKEQCIQELRGSLRTQSKWVKVHAAEYLLWSGYPEGVQKTFMEEEQHFGTGSPYRIGIWRVLAQATDNAEEKKIWTGKILKAFLDTNGMDRVHAVETLAKLGISPLQEAPKIARHALKSADKSLALYTMWSVSFSSADSLKAAQAAFFNLLMSEVAATSEKRLAAYVIRHMNSLNDLDWRKLSNKALMVSVDSENSLYLLSTAFVTARVDSMQSGTFQRIRENLLKYHDAPNKSDRIEMASALSEKGTKQDLPVLIAMLDNKNSIGIKADDADIAASAAYAILKIGRQMD